MESSTSCALSGGNGRCGLKAYSEVMESWEMSFCAIAGTRVGDGGAVVVLCWSFVVRGDAMVLLVTGADRRAYRVLRGDRDVESCWLEGTGGGGQGRSDMGEVEVGK